MARQRRRTIPVSCLLIVIVLCVLLAGGIWAGSQVFALAEREFGPPSPSLNTVEQFLYSARLLIARDALIIPAAVSQQHVQFEIAPGESTNSILLRLEQAGIVSDAAALRVYLVYTGLDTGIQSGKYKLSPGLNAVEIAGELQNPAPTDAVLVILPGWRAEEIAEALPTSGYTITPGDFIQAVRNPPASAIPASLQPATSLEGFLFPGEYRLPRETTLDELIAVMLARFDENVGQDIRDAYSQRGMTLAEGVTLASIIQKEGVVDDDRAMIASVFYNRLAIGMKLDSDPTAQYAYGYNTLLKTWWTNPVTMDQLNADSPYNTYIYFGLPPAPICNPGMTALRAAAFPADSPYYYFRAKCDGSGLHEFAVTFDEHLQNACQ